MPIRKKDVQAPSLPAERVVAVPELGGDVIVRALMLSDRLALVQNVNATPAQHNFAHIAALLSFAVVDADHVPLFSAVEWETWGATHIEAVLALWDVANKLSELDADAAKKNLKTVPSSSSP